MKMLMRPQKSQLPDTYIWDAPVWTSWKAGIHKLAGYRNFDVLLVGAAGGPSGRAEGKTSSGKTITAHPGGGGGGGSLRAAGDLLTLADSVGVLAGEAGSSGSDAGLTGSAGDGTDGYDTYFATWSATGGKGGKGGYVRANGNYDRSKGGDGGVGSLGGTRGDGDVNGSGKDGLATVLSGGLTGFSAGGGGGGWGKMVTEDSVLSPTDGGDGTSNVPGYSAVGQPSGTNVGGGGAGCGFKYPDDALTIFVRGTARLDAPFCNGAVLLALS
jgi:hypothetical protein